MPKIGMRIIKTAIAVFLCFVINMYITGGETPLYSTITAVICLQAYAKESIDVSKKRILGTIIGGVLGMMVLYMEPLLIPSGHLLFQYLLTSAGIIPVIYISVLLRQESASAIACVVFISITVGLGAQTSPLHYAIIRSMETIIGIFVAVGVNLIHPPKQHREDTLFVTGMTGILLDSTGTLSPRSKVELNRMISEGAAISVATEMTPATFLAATTDVHWQLPIIAMDGAVIYDIGDKRYLDCCSLPDEYKSALQEVFENANIHYFANVLIQDVLLIYYGNFHNDGEQQIYEAFRRSPHRNYIHRSVPEEGEVLYYLVVECAEKINKLKEILEKLDFYCQLSILDKEDETLSGYRYLKIYNCSAIKGIMLNRLKERVGKSRVVAFGSNENDVSMFLDADLSFAVCGASEEAQKAAKYCLPSQDPDTVVKIIRRLFQPLPWERKWIKLQNQYYKNKGGKP